MKYTLIIMRHAKTEVQQPGQKDFDRKLIERGRFDAQLMGQRIAIKGFVPDIILSSNATRTTQTTELIKSTPGFDAIPVELMQQLYHASPHTIESVVSSQEADRQTCMLVGHNPGVSQFVYDCIPQVLDSSMPTAAIAVMSFEGSGWHDFPAAKKTAELYDYPKK